VISCFHRELSLASLQNLYSCAIAGFSLNWVCQDCSQIVVFSEREILLELGLSGLQSDPCILRD
jgi:hypothetical protein